MKLIIESQFCAPILTWSYISRSDGVIWDVHSRYRKKSFRNRMYLLSSHGVFRLSIPLQQGKYNQDLCDVEISYETDWQKQHWQSIISAYNRSPFFEFFCDELESIYVQRPKHLFEFNVNLNQWIARQLNMEVGQETSLSDIEYSPNLMLDLRDRIRKNTKFEGQKDYLQVFSDRVEFQPNLSILDLLFNEGPNSKSYLDLYISGSK